MTLISLSEEKDFIQRNIKFVKILLSWNLFWYILMLRIQGKLCACLLSSNSAGYRKVRYYTNGIVGKVERGGL